MHIKEQLSSWHFMALSIFNEIEHFFFSHWKDGVKSSLCYNNLKMANSQQDSTLVGTLFQSK